MANPNETKILDLDAQHKLFIPEDEEELNSKFRFKLWYRAQVEAGQVWQVYRDGVHYDRLAAGPHVLWNGWWHQWKVLRINLRIVHLTYNFEGRVKGPQLPPEARSAAGVDLGCSVKATLALTCKIAN